MIEIEHMNEVLPRLWVGDSAAARPALDAGFAVLCVLENPTLTDEWHIPILLRSDIVAPTAFVRAYADRLEQTWVWIKGNWPRKQTLVHCGAGVERSPLTLAWFMCKELGLSLDQAYTWLKARRPIVEDRRAWLECPP